MGTHLAPTRRPTQLRRRAVAGFVTALAAVLASTQPAHANEGIKTSEALKVDAGGSRVATSTMQLLAGHPYRFDVAGTYHVGDVIADAECSMSQLDPIYMPGSNGTGDYELLVNGDDIAWSPVHGDLVGCDSTEHQYSFSLTPAVDGPIQFELNIPSDSDGASGMLDVQVTDLSASTAAPTTGGAQTPTYEAGPATSQPAGAPAAQPASRRTASAALPKSGSAAKGAPDARATLEELLGSYGVAQDGGVRLTPVAREGGKVLPDYATESDAKTTSLVLLSLVALAAAATAASPVRHRVVAMARGIDGFDMGQRQIAHRGPAISIAPVTVPARKISRRPSHKPRAGAAVAHRSAARTNAAATLIVNHAPSEAIATATACSCGYCS